MYEIDKTYYGLKLVFDGNVLLEEMARWVEDAKNALAKVSGSFGVLVDMRNLKPLSSDAQAEMLKGQILFKEKGMRRSVVILNSAITTSQFKRLAKESGIYEWERYINASSAENWEKTGIDWLVSGTDPDK